MTIKTFPAPIPSRRSRLTACFFSCLALMLFQAIAPPILAAGSEPGISFFELPADSLGASLKRFSEESGLDVIVPADLAGGAMTQPVIGRMLPRQAFDAMLAGTGFQAMEDEKTGSLTAQRGSSLNGQKAPLETAGAPPVANVKSTSFLNFGHPFQASGSPNDQVVALGAFQVNENTDRGYYSEQTMMGSRTAQNTLDIPSDISIINKELMDDLDPTQAQQVLNYGSAGIKQNQGFNDDFQIRGFRTLGAMRDGLTQPTNKSNELYDIDRIEVLKGPAAMLFGDETLLGGAVNLVTRRPTDTFHVEVTDEIANHDYNRGTLNVTGPVYDFKKEGIKVLYRVTLGGWKDLRFKADQHRDERFDGASIEWIFNDNTSITVNMSTFIDHSYMYFDDVSDPTNPGGHDVPDPLIPKFTFSMADPKDVFWNLKSKVFTTEFLHAFTDHSSIRGVFGFFDKEDRRRLIRSNGFMPGSTTMLLRTDLPLELDSKVQTIQVDYSHKLTIGPENNFWLTTHNEFEAGFESILTSGFQRLNTLTELPPIDIRDPDFSHDVLTVNYPWSSNAVTQAWEYHYYAQDAVKLLGDRLILVAGIRFIEHASQSINELVTPFVYSYSHPSRSAVHKYGVVYKLTPTISLYASSAENLVTAAGIIENAGTPYAYVNGDSLGKDNEIGLKAFGFDGHLYGSVAYFGMTETNLVVGAPSPDGALGANGLPLQINVSADETSKGWESEVGYHQDFGTFGHSDVILTYFQTASLTQAHTTFLNVSPYQYSALVKFSIAQGWLKGLSFGAGAHKQGAILELGGLVSNQLPVTAVAFASYQFGEHLTLRLNIDNLTNAWYIITGTGNSEGSDPRRITMGLTYRW